jgi:hypothetical protein
MDQSPEQQHFRGDLAESARGALIGSIVSGIFGVAWGFWGSSGLPHFAALCVQLGATLFGLIIVIAALKRRAHIAKGGRARGRALFSSRAYVLIVVAEVLAIIGSNVALTVTGQEQFRIALIAAIVGLHFLAFGRLFWSGFYWLGAAMLTASAVGTVVGMVTGDANLILVITGLGSALSLFIAAIPPLRSVVY